ncbi:hypothetical protein Nm8I071_23530 [Nonomuraea sp. TT08I-71]|nr:hypothetical protein Nm8I071_23530 [Nonomuraea sp. TT08I-71]
MAGTMRFDLDGGPQPETWHVQIRSGNVSISRNAEEADCVIRADQALFDQIVTGDANAYSAWLRNDLTCEGSMQLLAFFIKVFPGPAEASDPRISAARSDHER